MIRLFKKTIFQLLALIAVFLVVGCAARRNTAFNRTYHSVTAKYNILFNGSESFKEGLAKYDQSYTDNYALILPVFTYGNAELASSIKSEMDRSIEKSSKAIKLHSITKKPEGKKSKMTEKEKQFYSKNEYNSYIDEAYLLMGKAFFYQADYTSAAQTFEFIIKQFDDEKSKYMAYNWLVRANTERKDYREAQHLLDNIQHDIKYPDNLKYQLNLTKADLYIKQQNIAAAEPIIKEAIDQAKKKKDKLRLLFIYAQVNEKLNKYQLASEYYEKVIKMNPPYEMAFNAKIKRASMFTGGKSGNSIKAELLEMLEDDKNKEYLDQIYYALGDLELKNKNAGKAIEYFKQSTNVSVNNTNQKGLSYFALADIFFNQSKYVESQAYSDSAITMLNPEFPGYSELAKKNKYLSKLVENIKTVEFQDSIQRVAKMSEKDRLVFIQKIIDQVKIKEQQEKERENMASQPGDLMYARTNIRPANFEESGKWYFYNPNAKSFGEPEFRRLWGTRKLEDNWRRSNKQVIGVDQEKQVEISDDLIDNKKGLDNKKPEYYLVDLPLTDSLLTISHLKIQRSLYNVGEVYRNDLQEYDLAIKAYKDLINRYNISDYKVAAYYSLYKIYFSKGDYGQADIYKGMIIGNYPESNYAKVLLDPEFFKVFEKESKEQNDYYIATLTLFNEKKYAEVISHCDYGITTFKNNELTPKFKYIKLLSIGKLYGQGMLKNELEQFVIEYPKGELNKTANELLAVVREKELQQFSESSNMLEQNPADSTQQTPDIVQEEKERIKKLFSFNSNSEHYFILIIDKAIDINKIKFNSINYNLDYYIQKDYSTESEEFNKFFNSIIVKKFANAKEAMDYYNAINTQIEKLVENASKDDYQFFVISIENYNSFTTEKAIREYLLFFKENYLK